MKIAEYKISRTMACLYALIMGILFGIINCLIHIDLTLRPALVLWLLAAIGTVIFLHEGIHGAAALLFNHRPIFGLKPPLVYVTFATRIPRGHFILIALAPLVLLDIVFAALFLAGILKLFSYFCLLINTLGAIGDIWIFLKLLRHRRGILVQDTKTGIEVWEP